MSKNFEDLAKDGKVFIDELNKIRLANPGVLIKNFLIKFRSFRIIEFIKK